MAKSKKDLTEDMGVDEMAEAIIEHTGLSMEDLTIYMADETMMRTFYNQAMVGDPVPKEEVLVDRKPDPLPLVDASGRKIRKEGQAPAKRKSAKPPVHVGPGFISIPLRAGGIRKVNLLHVVADKTDQGFNKGRNNIIVSDPDFRDQAYDVVFEMWPDITEEFPIAIVEDFRLRAHCLFEVIQVQVGPKTTGRFKNKIVNRKGYHSLSPAVSESEVKKMHSYLLETMSEEAEIAELAAKMIGE